MAEWLLAKGLYYRSRKAKQKVFYKKALCRLAGISVKKPSHVYVKAFLRRGYLYFLIRQHNRHHQHQNILVGSFFYRA
jgi:hypothetical protein